ncbi:MAG: sialidase family protein [Candidatus Dormibacteria bacterium]
MPSRLPPRASTANLAAAVLLLLAACGLAGLSLVTRGMVVSAPRSNTLLGGSGANAIIDENNSPTVLRNPTDASNLVVLNRVDRPGYSAAVHWSVDGGATWAASTLPLPPGRDRPYAPDAAFSASGTLYAVYVNLEGIGNDPEELWVARSGDGGATFTGPYHVSGRYAFGGRIAVDGSGTVYVTWLQATSVGLLSMPGPAEIVMARSTDSGRSFSAPVRVSDAQRSRVGAATPVVDSSGNIDVLYEDFDGDVRDFLNLDGPPWGRPFALVLARSSDHGASFARGVVVDGGLVAATRFLVYLPELPSIAPSPDGSLYATWADDRSGAERVYLRRSADGGATWGAAVPVTGWLAGSSEAAWLPAVGVAPDGRVDVVFLAGHRDRGDDLVAAYAATSSDQGSSFTTLQLSTSAFNSSIGPLTGPPYLLPDLGSHLGVSSDDSGALAAWTDTRLGTRDSGRQDIGVARMAVSGAPIASWRLLASAVLGLAGAVALTTWWRRRRSPQAP